jgi:glycine cleavage system transcriptional repressor
MSLVAISVIGNDRPGIVAGVTRVLYESGCNLEDVNSTILRGHFAMTLIVRPPSEVTSDDLEERLSTTAEALDLVIAARTVSEADAGFPAPTHMVSVYGADQPGIVSRVADILATGGGNITDLTSRVIGEADRPVYALMMEVAISAPDDVLEALETLKREMQVDVTVHPIQADVL